MSALPSNGYGFLNDREQWGEGWCGVVQLGGVYYYLRGILRQGDFGASIVLETVPDAVAMENPKMFGITAKRAVAAKQANEEAEYQL